MSFERWFAKRFPWQIVLLLWGIVLFLLVFG